MCNKKLNLNDDLIVASTEYLECFSLVRYRSTLSISVRNGKKGGEKEIENTLNDIYYYNNWLLNMQLFE